MEVLGERWLFSPHIGEGRAVTEKIVDPTSTMLWKSPRATGTDRSSPQCQGIEQRLPREYDRAARIEEPTHRHNFAQHIYGIHTSTGVGRLEGRVQPLATYLRRSTSSQSVVIQGLRRLRY
jgi:hypothetical protein